MWHVSSRSGVATLRTAIHLLYLLTYLSTCVALKSLAMIQIYNDTATIHRITFTQSYEIITFCVAWQPSRIYNTVRSRMQRRSSVGLNGWRIGLGWIGSGWVWFFHFRVCWVTKSWLMSIAIRSHVPGPLNIPWWTIIGIPQSLYHCGCRKNRSYLPVGSSST